MVLIDRLRIIVLLVTLTMSAGCISSTQPLKLKQPAAITTAYVMQFPDRPDVMTVPGSFAKRVQEELGKRNLNATRVPFAELAPTFKKKRTTELRMAGLVPKATQTPYIMLVETQVRFYTWLSGRYRWNVTGRVTFMHAGDLKTAKSTNFEMAAHLQYDHQNEADALKYVEVAIAEQVGQAADAFLAGLEDVPIDVRVKKEPTTTRKFAANDSVYFIMIDRFENGDPSNDGDVDLNDPQAFHGGDIRGIINKLDYLKGLGVTTLWLSPVFKMRTTKFHGHGAFHGYWVEDLTAMEPRFGTESDLTELAAELKKRDMRVMLDMVLNHVAPESKLVAQKPAWFHHNGGITDWNDPIQLTTFDVHGLPDLDQDNPEVYAHLLEASKKWIDLLHPAGFRLDAVKHIPNTFWARYNKDIQAHAGASFLLLGEDLNGNPADVAKTAEDGGFNAMFDFPLHFAMIDVFCKDAQVGRLAAVLFATRQYPAIVRDRGLVTLLDNHDLPRVMTACQGDTAKVRKALTFMLHAQGTPSFTWGTENAQIGQSEPQNRADMQFSESSTMGNALKALLSKRAEHPALNSGTDVIIALEAELFAYVRIHQDEAALIVLNQSTALQNVNIPKELGLGDVAFEIPADTLTVEFISPESEGGFSHAIDAALSVPPTIPIKIKSTSKLDPGDRLFVVGSGPELGNWNVDHAPELTLNEDGSTVEVWLPRGGAFAYKFVIKKPNGTAVWEDGENRYLFVPQ